MGGVVWGGRSLRDPRNRTDPFKKDPEMGIMRELRGVLQERC